MKFSLNSQQQGSAAVAHRIHNPGVGGSIPSPATNTASPSRTLAADGGAGCQTSPNLRRPLRSRRLSLSTNRSDARAAGARRRLPSSAAMRLLPGEPLFHAVKNCLCQNTDTDRFAAGRLAHAYPLVHRLSVSGLHESVSPFERVLRVSFPCSKHGAGAIQGAGQVIQESGFQERGGHG